MARQPPFWRLMERVAMTLLDQHKNRSDNIEEPATNTDQPVMIKTRRRASVRLSDLKLTPPTWLIHGILETQALAFLIGASGSGKTFVAAAIGSQGASGLVVRPKLDVFHSKRDKVVLAGARQR